MLLGSIYTNSGNPVQIPQLMFPQTQQLELKMHLS